jgi:hypothetical protein
VHTEAWLINVKEAIEQSVTAVKSPPSFIGISNGVWFIPIDRYAVLLGHPQKCKRVSS